jgi:hypothetical protein
MPAVTSLPSGAKCTLSGVNPSARVVRSCRAGLLRENATKVYKF